MKKLRKLRKGLEMLLSVAMVLGLMPGVGIQKAAAETTSDDSSITLTALYTNGAGTIKYLLDNNEDNAFEKRYYLDNDFDKCFSDIKKYIDKDHNI